MRRSSQHLRHIFTRMQWLSTGNKCTNLAAAVSNGTITWRCPDRYEARCPHLATRSVHGNWLQVLGSHSNKLRPRRFSLPTTTTIYSDGTARALCEFKSIEQFSRDCLQCCHCFLIWSLFLELCQQYRVFLFHLLIVVCDLLKVAEYFLLPFDINLQVSNHRIQDHVTAPRQEKPMLSKVATECEFYSTWSSKSLISRMINPVSSTVFISMLKFCVQKLPTRNCGTKFSTCVSGYCGYLSARCTLTSCKAARCL